MIAGFVFVGAIQIAQPTFFKHETKKPTPIYSSFHPPSYSSKKTSQFLAAFSKAIAGWR
ncbi:hypothetical protein QUA20_12820 [Microcoleus sp. Pol7_A1]|uniref:hypothetical protein n=1 Tax=Microcoleus sp. Pol7_A1 TaxID=2818893 RepID=UPI002FD136ED